MKKIKVLIIVLISILVVICGILAYLYFGTNTLKSNKKMFNKYISQINLSEFVNFDDYIECVERTVNEPHTNDGNISIKIGDYVDESFKFKIDSDKDKDYTKGEITYSQDVEDKLKISYLRDNDFYAIKCFYKQYLAIREEDIPEFLENIGIDMNGLNESLDTIENGTNALSLKEKVLTTLKSGKDALNFNEKEEYLEKLNNILKKYLNNAINEIPDKNYVKIKKQEIEVDGKVVEADGYKITLNAEDVLKILNNIISTAKNDEELYNLIKEASKREEYDDFEFSDYQEVVEEMEKGLNNYKNIEDNTKLEITVYNQGEKTVKLYARMEEKELGEYIELSIENNKKIIINVFVDDSKTNITISKNNTNGENEIDISIKSIYDDEETVNLTAALLLKNKSLNEYEISFMLDAEIVEFDGPISIKYNKTTEFIDEIEIEKLEENDYVLINKLTKEQLKQIGEDLIKKIQDKIEIEKTLIGIMSLNGGLFSKASIAKEETQIAQVREVIILVKAEMLADYYEGNKNAPTADEVKKRIEKYLDDSYVINVTKDPSNYIYIVSAEGLDLGEDNKIDLS